MRGGVFGPMVILRNGGVRVGIKSHITDEQWERIRPSIARENRRSIIIVTAAFSIMMVLMLLMSFFSSMMSRARILYLISLMLSLLLCFVAVRVKPSDERKIGFLTYVTISCLLVYSTVLGTRLNADLVATAFPAFVLASPLLFTDRRRRIILCILINTAFFVCMSLIFDNPAFVVDDIVNSCLFSAVSIGINSYMLNVKLQQEYAQLKLAELSEKDLLTGVRNRNSYEQALSEYPLRCKRSLGCVYADLNGLHELNERSGHEAGDRMLKCLSAALREAFGKEDTYRIGGDEFVVFACDLDEGQIRSKVEEARRLAEGSSCHASFGVAVSEAPNIDVAELTRRAERQMYGEKRRYYNQPGVERRGMRD